MLNMRYDYCMIYRFHSPLGPIFYDWDGKHCLHVYLQQHDHIQTEHDDPVSHWFRLWFDGGNPVFPSMIKPATPFQAKMRPALLSIPLGETRTYGGMASQLGTSARAMGQALGANPLPIIIPCHRVIAADGLGGFACGLAWKRKLLHFENSVSLADPA